MIVCDTSIWIEYFRGRDPFFSNVSNLIENGSILGIECIFGELLQGVKSKVERKLVLECWEYLPKYSDAGLWLDAGEFSAIQGLSQKGVGLIDAAIAIAVLKSNSQLWTLDKKLGTLLPGRHRYTA